MRARFVLAVLLVLSLLGLGTAESAVAASDTTPPVLHSVSLASPGPFTAGDTVTVQWDATDNAAVMQVQVNLQDAAGKDHTVYANAPATSGSTKLDASWANGAVIATYVWVNDVNGNFSVYYRDGNLGRSPGPNSTHTVNVAAADFSTHDTGADLTPPVLNGINLTSPGPFTSGDTVTVSVSASDNSAVHFLNLNLRDAAGKLHSIQASGNPGTVGTVIDAAWANGPVHLFQVEVQDTAFNTSVYKADGTVTYSAGTTGPATHGVDLSAGDFSTYNTGADVTPPALSAIALTTTGPLVEGDEVRYSFTATDASGVRQVAVVLLDSANKTHELFDVTGAGAVVGTIDASWAIGTVRLDEVLVHDTMENESDYHANGQVVYTPPGSATHALDFASKSFEVQGRPSVAMQSTPPGTSTSSSARFVFSTADRDTPLADLKATCALDTAARACTPSGASFTTLPSGRHRLDVTVTDPQGHHAAASYSWLVDAVAPGATAAPFPSSATLGSTVPLRYSGTDTGTGLASYDVRYATATGASGFTSWTFPNSWQRTTATQVVSPYFSPGRTFCFAVRARDRAGNVSAWTPSRCVSRAYDDRVLTPSSGWYRVYLSSLYGGSALQTTRYGVTATTGTVTVRHLAVVATTCPSCGKVVVQIGGHVVATLNLASSTTRHRQLLSVPLSTVWTGAVRLRVVSTNRAVEVDGLLLSRI